MHGRSIRRVAVVALALFAGAELLAEVRLPSVFSNYMVLQRDCSVPVWGWANAGEQVTVSFAGQTKNTTADDDGC